MLLSGRKKINVQYFKVIQRQQDIYSLKILHSIIFQSPLRIPRKIPH